MVKKRYALLLILLCSAFLRANAQDRSIIAHPPLYVSGSATQKISGLMPSQVRRAYAFDQIGNQGRGQTIGIVNAFDHPSIEADLAVFDQAFNLPSCTTANGCFQKIYASGSQPATDALWALETALDVEWAHAIAPEARVMLVEAESATVSALLDAVDLAIKRGATVISMSWGAPEFSRETFFDSHFVAANVAFVAAAGNFGNPGFWPAASPYVTGVGGTKLHLDSQGNHITEVAWQEGGGGLSVYEVEPAYQAQFGIPNNPGGKRGVPDVAYNADPSTGFAVYDSVPFLGSGWIQVGGTSAGAPQWAALIAIANSIRIGDKKQPKFQFTGSNASLYGAASSSSYARNYHDITGGTNTNGQCGPFCSAGPGYDYVTGLGSPQANNLINALASAP